MKKVKCECGKRFTPSARGREQRYCSVKCRMRAYRKRAADKRNVTPDSETQETIALLRRQVARQQVLLSRQADQIPKPEFKPEFPITIEGGRWLKITSTTTITPGSIIRLFDGPSADVVLAKEGRVLITQDLQNGHIGELSIYDAKDRWKRNSKVRRGDLVKHWIANGKKRNVTPPEDEIKRLKAEVLRLSRRVKDLKQPNYSMAVIIEKATGREGYVARNLDGPEWAQGSSPKEALGDLVFGHAITRTVTVERVEFGEMQAPAKKKKSSKQVPCPVCSRKVKLIKHLDQFCVPKHRHELNRSKNCHGSDVIVAADGSFKS